MSTDSKETGKTEEHADHHEMGFWGKYVFSRDHKAIGMQFMMTALFMLFIGGGLAVTLRMRLAWPDADFMGIDLAQFGGETYNVLFSMHATVMIFFVIIPFLVGAFGNFVVPLHIGARDMAFPFLNGLSYWIMPLAGIVMFGGILLEGIDSGLKNGAFASGGWTSYPPLSQIAGYGQTLWCVSLIIVGTSSIMGAVNYVTTIIKMRAPGMTFGRMSLTVWSVFITAILVLFGTPVLTSALIMLILDRHMGTTFFNNDGQPLLYQHLFWFYSHPAVYIMILPGMGMASDIIAVFARKPIFGYKAMAAAMAGIAGLGFIVWGHHMFQSGMDPRLGTYFMIATMFIALPSAVKSFNWLGTLWRGNIHFTTPMLNALGFVSMFIIGGLSGIFMAATTVDLMIHDTYFIVAHIHYVLFGGSLFGVFAGITYWFPKMFGRMFSETLGKIHFVLTFIAFNCTFFPMHIVGAAGLPRRYASYIGPGATETWAHLQPYQQFMTISAIVLGLAQVLFLVALIYSAIWGKKAEKNPWKANTLEWTLPSPPAHGNFHPDLPTVYRGPYEYNSDLVEEDYLPQDRNLETTGAGSDADGASGEGAA
ncbi:MAG: cbb3-type cytochrome c oxidase subunit I [Planctomycetota bacterium]|nr:cbb3-type cytochrome c oxidase subunit I [Planctomycetota bacterium]